MNGFDLIRSTSCRVRQLKFIKVLKWVTSKFICGVSYPAPKTAGILLKTESFKGLKYFGCMGLGGWRQEGTDGSAGGGGCGDEVQAHRTDHGGSGRVSKKM